MTARKKATKPLSDKQLMFVEEYLKDGNATQAAMRSGYSEKTAYRSGYMNIKNVQIQEMLDKRRGELRDQLQKQFTGDAVLARRVLVDIMNDPDANENVKAKVAIDFLDRAGFKAQEKVEHSGGMTINNPFEGLTEEQLRKLADGK